MSDQEIYLICKKYKIENYSINPDGTIDVDGDVHISYKSLTKLPLKFGRINGSFHCNDNKLTSLDGSPSYVGGNFGCGQNQLTTFDFSPKEVGGYSNFMNNSFTSLKGATKGVNTFYFLGNPLPNIIYDNMDNIDYILDNQNDYGIWRTDGSFNIVRFDIMMKDKDI